MSAATLAYVWPALMLATVLATLGGVAFMAWRERGAGGCDTRHTAKHYSAAPYSLTVVPSPTATSAAFGRTETE